MSRIRSKDTGPELRLRRALWAAGCRYRLHYNLPGKPDMVFLRPRIAVFVDGCFWHGCPLHYAAPRTREEFWKEKLRRNVMRDLAVDDALASDNWRVIRVWQHELARLEDIVAYILENLGHNKSGIYQTYQTDTQPFTQVAESAAQYGPPLQSHQMTLPPGLRCECGSGDVRILEVKGHGSLRPNARERPESLELICRVCREVWNVEQICNLLGM